MSFALIPSGLSAVMALALSGLVLRRARRLGSWAFAWGMTGLGAAEVVVTLLLVEPSARWPLSQVIFTLDALSWPAWAVFSVVFARADADVELRRWRSMLVAFGVVSLTAAASTIVYPLVLAPPLPWHEALPLTPIGKAVAAFGVLVAVFVLFQLESTLRNSQGVARWQIKYFVLGVMGIFAFKIFILSQTLLEARFEMSLLPAQSTAFVLAGLLIAFGIVRRRLLDVNVFVSRHVVYHSLAIGTVGAYLLSVGAAAWAVRTLGIPVNLLVASLLVFGTAAVLVIALLSERLRHRVKHSIARHFYSHKYDYRDEWTKFTAKMTSVVTPDAIAPKIIAMVSETMGVRKAAVFLGTEGREYRLVEWVGTEPGATIALPDASPALLRSTIENEPVTLTDIDPADPLEPVAAPLRQAGFTHLVLLAGSGRVLGVVLVGPPTESPSHEDRELLSNIASQAATTLLNARLTEQLAHAREVEAMGRISSFMLHDLKNCVSMLSLVVHNAETAADDPEFRQDAFRTVAESVRTMQQLIGRLSNIPKSLEPRLSTVDLRSVVEDMEPWIRRVTNARIRVSLDLRAVPPVYADREQCRRIVENLVINGIEAIPANGEVIVVTRPRGQSACLEVSDTGAGIAESQRSVLFTPFRSTKPHGLGIGLYQVKSMVEAHGGHIEVESRVGLGTTFVVQFPASGEEPKS
jgi:putative PEP-CTERM system histidine kinase